MSEPTRDEMRAQLEKLRRTHKIKWTGPPDGEPCSGETTLYMQVNVLFRTMVCKTCGTLIQERRNAAGEWEPMKDLR